MGNFVDVQNVGNIREEDLGATVRTKMNKSLNQARAISFLTLLSLDKIPLKDLRRISPDWVLWLQDYYKGKDKVKLENIPFYIKLKQFETVFKKILVKDDLPNFSMHLVSMNELDGYYAENDFLYIPADVNELYLYNSSIKAHKHSYLPQSILKRLKMLPKGLIVILAKYDSSMRVLSYVIDKEWVEGNFEQSFSEREIAVNKFCRDNSMEKTQVFRCKAGQEAQKGFVLGINENMLDMRWIR